MNRKFIEYFTKIAKTVSELSTCYSRKVGAVIVKNNRILSTGYNGTPSGMLECRELNEILKWFYNEEVLKVLNSKKSKSEVVNYLDDLIYRMKGINYDMYLTPSNIHYNREKYENVFNIIDKYKGFYVCRNDNELVKRRQLIWTFERIKKMFENEDWLAIDNLKIFLENMNFIHNKYEIHAEINAITQAAKFGVSISDSMIFVTTLPCIDCAKAITGAGIKEVFYVDNYIDGNYHESSKNFLIGNNIKISKVS